MKNTIIHLLNILILIGLGVFLAVMSDYNIITGHVVFEGYGELALIKEVHRDSFTFGGSDKTVSIGSKVNTSTSVLFYSVRQNTESPSNGLITGRILNPTQLQFTRVGDGDDPTIVWYVAEFKKGVRVNRGRSLPGASLIEKTVPIGGNVNLDSSFVVPGGYSNEGFIFDDDDYLRVRLINSTHVGLMVDGSLNDDELADWQVVEFNGAFVQRGTLALSGTSDTQTLGTAIDTDKTFLIFSYAHSGGDGVNDQNIRGEITSSTKIRFTREGSSGTARIAWEVVELPEGNSVQHDVQSFGNGTSINDVTIDPVDLDNSVAFASSAPFSGLSMGSTYYSGIEEVLLCHLPLGNPENAQTIYALTPASADPIFFAWLDKKSKLGSTVASTSSSATSASPGSYPECISIGRIYFCLVCFSRIILIRIIIFCCIVLICTISFIVARSIGTSCI